MISLFEDKKLFFLCGSQHLYGASALKQVENNTKEIVSSLNKSSHLQFSVVFKEVLTTPEMITQCCAELSFDDSCIGIIIWMHTFSPAKMWINGLKKLSKPICHLHTQFNTEIPWSTIDMDFMNLNQSSRNYQFD